MSSNPLEKNSDDDDSIEIISVVPCKKAVEPKINDSSKSGISRRDTHYSSDSGDDLHRLQVEIAQPPAFHSIDAGEKDRHRVRLDVGPLDSDSSSDEDFISLQNQPVLSATPLIQSDDSSESSNAMSACGQAALERAQALINKSRRSKKAKLASTTSTSLPAGESEMEQKPKAKARGNQKQKVDTQARQIQKQKERETKAQLKLQEKESRLLARQKQKEEKEKAKAEATEAKQRIRNEAEQISGKYAAQEVAVLMNRDLVKHPILDVAGILRRPDKDHNHPTGSGSFHVQEFPSALGCHTVQWIRKDFSAGGAADAVQKLHNRDSSGYELLPWLVVVFDVPHDYIRLISPGNNDEQRPRPAVLSFAGSPTGPTSQFCDDDDSDDFPKLDDWIRQLEIGWRMSWRVTEDSPIQRPRIVLILNNVRKALDNMWKTPSGRRNDLRLPTEPDLDDSFAWMLIQHQVECILCTEVTDIAYNIRKMTWKLAHQPYQRQQTELSCIKKLKPNVADDADPLERASDCWCRQLQQIPRVSSDKARYLVANHFPTLRSLWEVYQSDQLSESEKRDLLADKFHPTRNHYKLSHHVFSVLTCRDPNELLS
jgi:hypothetical protein